VIGPVILTYHALSELPSPVCLSPRRFERQLQAFKMAGWESVSLSAVLDWLVLGKPLPSKAIAITFDDGYASTFSEAFPRLQSFGFVATVFLVSGYCGKSNRWPGQPAAIPELPMLTWEEVAQLAEAGLEFGAHTHSHLPLVRLPLAQAQEEMVTSKNLLEARTGKGMRLFSPPYGVSNRQIEALIARHFDGSVSARLGRVSRKSGRYALPRVDAYYLSGDPLTFLDRPFAGLRFSLRNLARGLRRRIRPDWDRIDSSE